MRKLIGLALTLIIVLSLMSSASADVDLKSMDVNALNELRIAIENEILAKGGDVQIPAGTYIGGADIKAGNYEFKLINGNLTTYLFYPAGSTKLTANYIDTSAYVRITINEGDKLILNDPCFMRKAGNFGF